MSARSGCYHPSIVRELQTTVLAKGQKPRARSESLANNEERKANSEHLARRDDVSAFILAGGRSSRMGADKALLPYGEKNLLQRTLQTVSAIAETTYIVGPRERYAEFGNVIEDIYPGSGPLGGIHAALQGTGTDLNLILSVDMPLMTTAFLSWLTERARTAQEVIVVPDAAGGLQPLCAIYRPSVREAAERVLRNGDYKIGHLFSQVPTRIITEQEIVASGFSTNIFQNINTPEEYQTCRQ